MMTGLQKSRKWKTKRPRTVWTACKNIGTKVGQQLNKVQILQKEGEERRLNVTSTANSVSLGIHVFLRFGKESSLFSYI